MLQPRCRCVTKISAAVPICNAQTCGGRLGGCTRSPSDTQVWVIRGSTHLEPNMSTRKLRHVRLAAFSRQGGRCYYCKAPMQPTGSAKPRQLQLECTAEHLIPTSEGGRTDTANIVAACRFCNQTRHKARRPKSAEQYMAHVQRRISLGRWNVWMHAVQPRDAAVRDTPFEARREREGESCALGAQ